MQDKVAIITGASSGIGRAAALKFGRLGSKVVLVARRGEILSALEGKIKSEGGDALSLTADVTYPPDVERVVRETISTYGGIDILINAAGGNSPKGTTDAEMLETVTGEELQRSIYGLDIEGFRWVFDLNLSGTLLPTLAFTRDMLEKGSGAVVNFSSMSALRPLTRVGAYSAAKAAVTNLTEWLAVHLAKQNIRVNAVAPGFFVGEQNRFLLYDEKTGELSSRGQKILNNTPMGRFGDYEEIHGTVAFLLSGMASFITGITVPIDGGFNAYAGV